MAGHGIGPDGEERGWLGSQDNRGNMTDRVHTAMEPNEAPRREHALDHRFRDLRGKQLAATHPPPLEPGDHLTRDEFERRYEATPGLKKAELIEGVVYMPSPVRLDQHGSPRAALIGWLWYYRVFTPGVRRGAAGKR